MPVYKSSPERTRRLFGSGVIFRGPGRPGSQPSRAAADTKVPEKSESNAHDLGAGSAKASGPYLTEEQAVELREIFLERGTEFYYEDVGLNHLESKPEEGGTAMPNLRERAEDYARLHHKGQTRKGEAAEPYITHVHEVAFLVSGFGGDDIAVAGAWLHDVVEDCTPAIEDVITEFGADVGALVAEVTDDKSLEKAERKASQLENASKKSDRACLIKWADKTSNLRSIALSPPPWTEARKREYIDWAEQVTGALSYRPEIAVKVFGEAKALALSLIKGENR